MPCTKCEVPAACPQIPKGLVRWLEHWIQAPQYNPSNPGAVTPELIAFHTGQLDMIARLKSIESTQRRNTNVLQSLDPLPAAPAQGH
jgi:hypothetical protein